jgi:hypothetical protein
MAVRPIFSTAGQHWRMAGFRLLYFTGQEPDIIAPVCALFSSLLLPLRLSRLGRI